MCFFNFWSGPDPDSNLNSLEMLDPDLHLDPDTMNPDTMNPDPQHC
jgi:hypothetical protein